MLDIAIHDIMQVISTRGVDSLQNDRFVWDDDKQEANIIKHKVSFDEAASVFDDEYALYADDEGINYDDIPPVTSLSGWRKNPFAGRFKDGYTVIVEREGYNEVRKYDFTKIPRPSCGNPTPVEVSIVQTGIATSN